MIDAARPPSPERRAFQARDSASGVDRRGLRSGTPSAGRTTCRSGALRRRPQATGCGDPGATLGSVDVEGPGAHAVPQVLPVHVGEQAEEHQADEPDEPDAEGDEPARIDAPIEKPGAISNPKRVSATCPPSSGRIGSRLNKAHQMLTNCTK